MDISLQIKADDKADKYTLTSDNNSLNKVIDMISFNSSKQYDSRSEVIVDTLSHGLALLGKLAKAGRAVTMDVSLNVLQIAPESYVINSTDGSLGRYLDVLIKRTPNTKYDARNMVLVDAIGQGMAIIIQELTKAKAND